MRSDTLMTIAGLGIVPAINVAKVVQIVLRQPSTQQSRAWEVTWPTYFTMRQCTNHAVQVFQAWSAHMIVLRTQDYLAAPLVTAQIGAVPTVLQASVSAALRTHAV